MRDKASALQQMDVADKAPFIHVGRGPAGTAGIRIMMPLAPHPGNRNEVIAWDLAQDPRQLLDIDAETVRRRLLTRFEDRPPGFQPMPLHCIAANKSPAVFRDLGVLPRARAAELGIDLQAALANLPVMAAVLETVDLSRLLQVVFAREPVECDPEEALYAGFVGNGDRRMLDGLRALDPAGLAAGKPEFSDPRLGELFLRYKARHYPHMLSQRELDRWEEHRFRKLITGYPGSRTVAMLRAAAAQCRQTLSASAEPVDPAQYRILDDVLAHANKLAAEIDPFDSAAPDPAPAAPAQATAPAPAPVQPDLFGGADVTVGTRPPRTGRR
jgi:exodeoxyribonuclease-1